MTRHKKFSAFCRMVFIPFALLLSTRVGAAAEPISLTTPTGILYGTLELPKTKLPCPVALFLSGSGPTNRDGDSATLNGENDSLRMLAEALAASGIASVRYDKRGVAASSESGADESKLRFENYIDDAVAWGKKLRADKRFTTLAIIGHSEGSLIGMVAAEKLGANSFVSLAGAGLPAGDILLTQLRPKLPPELMTSVQSIIQSLNAGKTVDNVPPQLGSLFRPDVQPYLISWFRYDPRKEIAKLKMKVLIVQGTTDIQVSETDAKLLATNQKKAKLVVIKGMNHVLKQAPKEPEKQMRAYIDPALPLSPGLANAVVAHLKS